MALIDIVKCTIVDGELCRKFPKDNIKLGSQLITNLGKDGCQRSKQRRQQSIIFPHTIE